MVRAPVTPETKIAAALDADPGLIERLIALNAVFAKLRNPVLRKTMAKLVSFSEAAKVAGVPLEAMLAVANGHGAPAPAGEAPKPEAMPDWAQAIDLAKATTLDVRPLLARGEEPLSVVMRTAKDVPAGGALVLDAPFDPAPLRRVLGTKGFAAHAANLADGHWRVFFLKRGEAPPSATAPGTARHWREGDLPHIDVRGLEPPEPMLAILRLLEAPGTGDTVIVHHERDPIYLYPELAERGWAGEIVPGDEGEVRLRLARPPT